MDEQFAIDAALELVSTPIIITVAWLAIMAARQLFERAEQRLLQLGFGLHVLGSFAQVVITREYYGSGDIVTYWREGVMLADALRFDFFGFAPLMIEVFLHQDSRLPFLLYGTGATASQSIVSGFLQFLTGDSIFGSSVLIAMAALAGKIALYAAVKDDFEPERRQHIGAAILLLPSTVYWCGSLSKEAIAIGAFGLLIWALRRIADRKRLLLAVPLGLASLVMVAMIKPYILLVFSIAAGVWVYWSSQRRKTGSVTIRPVYLALGGALTLAGLATVAELNPEYSADNVKDRATKQQIHGAEAAGDSYYELGAGTDQERSLQQQLLLAPAGLFTALFRPLATESRSAMVFLNSIESTAIFIAVVLALWRLGLKRAWSVLMASPTLMFSLVFTLGFGAAVGVLTTNLGTLSRYRAPMMPFFGMIVVVLWAESKRRVQRVTPVRPSLTPAATE